MVKIMIDTLIKLANELEQKGFDKEADIVDTIVEKAASLEKNAYVRRRGNKWVVLSEKGKVLGTYNTKSEAVKRLKQIEYFKNKD